MSRMIQTHDMLAGTFGRPAPQPYKSEIPNYDSEDDWEYEYSNTETETYYLTLDLSIPEFTTRDSRHVAQAGRGGYLSSWIGEPDVEQDATSSKTRYRFAADDMAGDDDDDDEEVEREEADAEADADMDADDDNVQKKRNKGKGKADGTENQDEETPLDAPTKPDQDAAEVQILNLHSSTPIIAYRGRIFEATWAENTGTELIFSPHDPAAPLPRIAALPDNIDLLAASSARLLTTERKIQPRMDTNLAEVKEAHGIRVVPGRDLNGERRKQASFLENLMAVKKMRGETDGVPVVARPPANKEFRDDRDPDWKPRRRKVRAVEAPPRVGRTATLAGGTDAPMVSASGEVGEDEEGEDARQQDIRFQTPWQPPVASNGAVPFFSTPQFRPRRKRQELPGRERRGVVNKVTLPVERSARTTLLSEDHGISVSSGGLRGDEKGKEVDGRGEGGSDEEMGDV